MDIDIKFDFKFTNEIEFSFVSLALDSVVVVGGVSSLGDGSR